MTVFAIGEPEYEKSNWYRSILDGLYAEKRQKRFDLVLLDGAGALADISASDDDAVFVIGTHSSWIAETTARCEQTFGNRVVVLGNHSARARGQRYSVVTTDIAYSVRMLYTYLCHYGRTHIALYGVNPSSASDAYKKEGFLACGGREEDLFYNTASLEQCYADFSRRAASFDGVICVNEYAAVSFVRHLADSADEAETPPIFVTSCGGKMLVNFVSPTITHTENDYVAFARAGVEICRMLQRGENVHSVTVRLAGNFVAGETTQTLPLPKIKGELAGAAVQKLDPFYADAEIAEMMRVETLLDACTDEDRGILGRILAGETYAEIAETLYMSTNGIKYKAKQMFELCGVETRSELVALLKKYYRE